MANFVLVANWLQEKGVIDWARYIHKEYLTGTAVTIIVVLLILLVSPGRGSFRLGKNCPVCDHRVRGGTKYCGDCGSRL